MIKKIFNASMYLLLMVMMLSCNKELGNYKYSDLHEIKVEDIEELYTALNQKQFKIDPSISVNNKPINADEYTYEWYTINKTPLTLNGDLKRVLGRKLNLDTTLTLPPGPYDLYLRIKEVSTGLIHEHVAALTVTSELGEGWLILNDVDGHTRLDMLNFNLTTEHYDSYPDILHSHGDIDIKGSPKLVYYLYDRDPFNNKFTHRIYVGTDKATYSFNNTAYIWTDARLLNKEVLRPTSENYRAEVIKTMGGSSTTSYILDNEGALMHQNVMQTIIYGTPFNRVNGGARLNISKYIAEDNNASAAFLVVFDKDKRRFLVHSGTNKELLSPGSSDLNVFTPEDVKMDLLYMEQALTAQKQFYALLKDPTTQEIKLLRFARSGTNFNILSFESVDNTHHIDEASMYAVDPSFGYIFYTVGKKVIQYNPFGKTYTTVFDAGIRNISLMKFQRPAYLLSRPRIVNFAKKLMICTYDPANPTTSGKIDFHNIFINGTSTIYESYSGFSKIVDVTYRE